MDFDRPKTNGIIGIHRTLSETKTDDARRIYFAKPE
jgi:hypothetical protein